MALHLYFHPLSSFSWKVLIALYERGTSFEPHVLELGRPEARQQLEELWPMARFPVLQDDERQVTVPESSIVIEYLELHYPAAVRMIDADPRVALETRAKDRFYDTYVHHPMQRIVFDRLRPARERDASGVEQAKRQIATAYRVIERDMSTRVWASGAVFTMADCAAAPALDYANRVVPLGDAHPFTSTYLRRLKERPSFARVLDEAKPYFYLFPAEP